MDNDTTKEVAKTTGKAIDLVNNLGGFFSKVVGEACQDIGSSLGDWAKYYRYKNLLRIKDKVDEIHQRRKIEGKSIPLQASIGIPLLEAASTVEDDDLTDMWAYLIANSTDPSFDGKTRRSFIDILSSMDPMDARMIDWFSKQGWNNAIGNITPEVISDALKLKVDDVKISLNNLKRLNLIDIFVPTTPGHILVAASLDRNAYRINETGWALLKLCKDKKST